MKTTNKRRPYLEIPKDEIDALPPELRSIFTTLNERLKAITELHESTAGLRGPVGIAKQTKKDNRGVVEAGLQLEGNRAANAADPIDDQDLVTLGYLKRQLACSNLSRILETCAEEEDLLDDDELSACEPLEFSGSKATDTGLTNIHATQALNEFIYVMGDDTTDGKFQVYRRGDNDPVLVGELTTTEIFTRMIIQSRFIYGCNPSGNLTVIDVTKPDAPDEVAVFAIGINAVGIHAQGRFVFVAGDSAIKIIDVSLPGAPVVVGSAT